MNSIKFEIKNKKTLKRLIHIISLKLPFIMIKIN